MSDTTEWFYSTSGEQSGPVSGAQLQQLALTGEINAETPVWTEGMENWLPAGQIENLLPEAAPGAGSQTLAANDPEYGAQATAEQDPWAEPENHRPSFPSLSISRASYSKFLWLNLYGPLIFTIIGCIFLFLIPSEADVEESPPAVPAINLNEETAADDLLDTEEAVETEEVDFGELLGLPDPSEEDLQPDPSQEQSVFLLGVMLVSLFIVFLLSICGWIYSLMLLHRAWRIVQPAGASTTPGKAVGFLFIPLFNLFWYFIAYAGLAENWNRAMDTFEETANAPRFNKTYFFGFAIMAIVFYPIGIIFYYFLFADICRGINYIANLQANGRRSLANLRRLY
ncbi:MAG: DUF4339 domain-containing protein [Verrucomicrobiota bacterium JB023]|nr:DUF4339 domain-containing protein [Verrucomicrobiota bacterium JB023]